MFELVHMVTSMEDFGSQKETQTRYGIFAIHLPQQLTSRRRNTAETDKFIKKYEGGLSLYFRPNM